MAIRYKYQDNVYNSLDEIREHIWQTNHIVFGKADTVEEFADWSYTVTKEEYDPMDEMELEALRKYVNQAKEIAFNEYSTSKYTYIDSSLGFPVNANDVANRNIEACILQVTKQANTLTEEGKMPFNCFDNEIRPLSKEELETIQLEVSENGTRAYGVKWVYETQIQAATTNAQLKALYQAGFDFRPDSQKEATEVTDSES